MTSSKAFGTTSLSVTIGMRFEPDTFTFQPQLVGGRNPLRTW